MEILFSFGVTALGILAGWLVFEIICRIFIRFARLDDREDDLWPAKYIHRHPTYTYDELLRNGFSADDKNQRHKFYRTQVPQKAVELFSRGWVGIAWRHLAGHDAVEEGEEGGDHVL